MKKNIIILVVSIISMSVFAQDNIKFNYFLKGEKGSSTTLNVYSGSDKKIGSQKIEITEKFENEDTTFAKITSVISGMGTVRTTYMTKSYNDSTFVELKDYLDVANFVKMGVTVIEPEWMFMPATVTEGQEIQGYVMTRDQGNRQLITKMIDRKVVGFETITTPVGEFECVKITYTIEASTGYGIFISNYIDWYNKDLGLIRQEAYTKEGRLENSFLLQSFDIK